MRKNGTPLQKIRAKQMIEITEEALLEKFVPELAQLITITITVNDNEKFSFDFMDGTRIMISLS